MPAAPGRPRVPSSRSRAQSCQAARCVSCVNCSTKRLRAYPTEHLHAERGAVRLDELVRRANATGTHARGHRRGPSRGPDYLPSTKSWELHP
jgi:hypothetical protein